MTTKKSELSFEEALSRLEAIVSELEQGDVPLERALEQFQEGMKLSKHCQDALTKAEQTLTRMMTEDGTEVDFETETAKDENQ